MATSTFDRKIVVTKEGAERLAKALESNRRPPASRPHKRNRRECKSMAGIVVPPQAVIHSHLRDVVLSQISSYSWHFKRPRRRSFLSHWFGLLPYPASPRGGCDLTPEPLAGPIQKECKK